MSLVVVVVVVGSGERKLRCGVVALSGKVEVHNFPDNATFRFTP